MPNKPIRMGLKVFAICNSAFGYTNCFQVASGVENKEDSRTFGATAAMVVHLTRLLPGTGYNLHMDNYFSMQTLFRYITSTLLHNVAGTLRSNRIPKLLIGNKITAHVGEIQTVSTTDTGAPSTAVRWMDKGMVYFLSTMHDHNLEAQSVSRRHGSSILQVPAPKVAVD